MTVSVPGGIVVACPCGEVYELRPEYASHLLECPVCHRHLRAGQAPGTARLRSPDVDLAFDRDLFLLNERAFTITSKYEVLGEDGTPVLYVERPTYPVRTLLSYVLGFIGATIVSSWLMPVLAAVPGLGYLLAGSVWIATFVVVSMSARPVRHVTVYRDDSRRERLLGVRQDQRVAVITRTYTVVLPAGEPIARLRKVYPHNVVRKRWYVETPAGDPLAMAIEDSMVLSLLRRVLGPLFGILRTNFLIERADGEVIGEFNRKLTLFDRYVLDLRADSDGALDRRVALALGVMLDTGERR